MKISFLYKVEWDWNDGLKKAIDVLSEKHDVKFHNGTYTNYLADVVLVWGALGSWQAKFGATLPYTKAICIAGGNLDDPIIHKYDIVFVETTHQQRYLKQLGVNAKLAFGVNNDIFFNRELPVRPIDYFFPAAFARWKRHELFIQKKGLKVAVGEMQPNGVEKDCYEMCYENGVIVMPQINYEATSWLYNQSKNVYLPSTYYGGCERAVLEGLSCGCNVEVEPDNDKLTELLSYCKSYGVPSYVDYAMALERELFNAE